MALIMPMFMQDSPPDAVKVPAGQHVAPAVAYAAANRGQKQVEAHRADDSFWRPGM